MYFATPGPDLALQVLVNQHWHNSVLDVLMPLASSRLVLAVLIVLGAAWAIRRLGWRQTFCFLLLLAALGCTDFATKQVKHAVERVRPLNDIPGTRYVEDGEWRQRPPDFVRTKMRGQSYPSAHAANTACLAVLAMLLWPRLRWWPLLLPLVTGYSRIYLGKHYPTDVLAGWLLGAVVATLLWLAWTRWLRDRLLHPPPSAADG